MRTSHRLASALLAALIGTAGMLVSAGPAAATGPYTANILGSVNASRSSHGLPRYTLRSDLSSVAYAWTKKMAARNTLQHNPSLTSQVHGWRFVGENVGYAGDWKTVMAAFMASPAHKANILDRDFTEIGLGVVVVGGRLWVTQVFREPLHASTTTTHPRTTTHASTPAARSHTAAAPHVAARPTPAQLLAGRIRTASRLRTTVPPDPVGTAVGFAAAMGTVAR